MLKLVFSGIVLIGILAGCTPALYQPTAEQASTVPLADLQEGRKLYVQSCGSCHTLHRPHQYAPEVWQHNITEMQQRAKITDRQKELILAYLLNAPAKGKQ